MAAIEKEQVITSYSGKLYSRLFGYMKPYLNKFVTALILVLIVSGISLYQPMVIARVIDTYIGGYNAPYAVTVDSLAQTQYEGQYLTKKFDTERPYEVGDKFA